MTFGQVLLIKQTDNFQPYHGFAPFSANHKAVVVRGLWGSRFYKNIIRVNLNFGYYSCM